MGGQKYRVLPSLTLKQERHFWAKVNKGVDCWIWRGRPGPGGYGQFHVRRVGYPAHRMAWQLAHGPIPEGLLVCHHCDNRICVRPSHLFLGTHKDNMQDAVVKGRIARGESQGGSKLTANDVVAIRNAYAAGGQTQEAIARKYDVTKSLIGCIVRGEHWRHVGGKSNNGIAANNRARGERNGNVKLTVDDIRAIRERYAAGEGSQETLAKEYGTVQSHVGRIVNRQNWRHI